MAENTQNEKVGKDTEWYEKPNRNSQANLMGARRWELWKSGAVKSPSDFIYIKPNSTWGGSPAVKTFDMLGADTTTANANKSGGNSIKIKSETIAPKIITSKITDDGVVINPMATDEYNKIKAALAKQGVEVFAAAEGDDLRYMLRLGAEGTYSNNRITHIGNVPSRGTFLEEIIHMHQSKAYGELNSTDSVELYAREIEANRKLLRYNQAYKLDEYDILDIRKNLKIWEEKFENATGKTYDASNYRGNN